MHFSNVDFVTWSLIKSTIWYGLVTEIFPMKQIRGSRVKAFATWMVSNGFPSLLMFVACSVCPYHWFFCLFGAQNWYCPTFLITISCYLGRDHMTSYGFNRISWYFTIAIFPLNGIKVLFFPHSLTRPVFSFLLSFLRLCWFCPVYQPSLWSSPSWWSSLSSYTTAAVTAVTGARDQRRRRRRMKMPAQVTVTAGRRGGASAASRGWRWRPSRCAGEKEASL